MLAFAALRTARSYSVQFNGDGRVAVRSEYEKDNGSERARRSGHHSGWFRPGCPAMRHHSPDFQCFRGSLPVCFGAVNQGNGVGA